MKHAVSKVRWLTSLLAGAVVIVLSLVTTTLVVTVYAFYLAFKARGAPDSELIGRFAQNAAPWLSSIADVVFALVVAVFVVRRTREVPGLQGLTVGLFAGLLGLATAVLFGGGPSLAAAGIFVLVVAAGWLGGTVAGQR